MTIMMSFTKFKEVNMILLLKDTGNGQCAKGQTLYSIIHLQAFSLEAKGAYKKQVI